MKKIKDKGYLLFISQLKENILESRYRAAGAANAELVLLYYNIGKMLSEKIETNQWGARVIVRISDDLQKELPGLRGFSVDNLKKMRVLFEAYPLIGATLSHQLQNASKDLPVKASGSLNKKSKEAISISATLSHQLEEKAMLKYFFGLSFSHHYLIASQLPKAEDRWFYIKEAVANTWSYRVLEHHIESNYHKRKGKLQSNFDKVLPAKMRNKAMSAFKDEYLLDFINIGDNDDERVLEQEIVHNVKEFIMRLGNGFSFIGNQHRIVVDEEESFVDLLFYNRILQCLVAFDLKRGKFKPEHAGKMNYYLNAIDDLVRLEHENPSIGIILCKEKKNAIVEYAFRDMKKAMGVATYKFTTDLPKKMRGILPDVEQLKRLLK